MPNEIEKLNKLLELLQNDTITPKELEQFLVMVLDVIKKSRDDVSQVMTDKVNEIRKVLQVIDQNHSKVLEQLKSNNSAQLEQTKQEVLSKLAEAQSLLQEVKAIEVSDGEDGVSPDPEEIIQEVLTRMPTNEYEPDDAEEIASKLSTLTQPWLEASMIKNLPEPTTTKWMGGGSRYMSRMADVKVTDIQDGDALIWNAAHGRFENSPAGSGGGGTWGSITGTLSNQTDLQTALDAKQPLDSDLTTIAGLTATSDNFMQAKAGAWASRTVAQVKTDLGLTGTNSGDQTSIVGITGTKAQFDTAVTDGNFLYVGDVTQYTDEMVDDRVAALLVAGTNITLTYNDGAGTLTIDAAGGAGSGATTALDNLASVAINTSLISDTDVTDDLGSAAKRWNNLFVGTIGATGTRITKLWATDITVTNAIAGSVTGNAATATALQNARTINGTSFDGTGNITVTAAAGTLTGATLNATVTASSLTSVGTLTSLTMGGAIAMGTSKITGLGDPSSAQDAATKAYVDNAVLGQNYKEAVGAATTANLVGTYSNGVSGVGATFTYTATGVDTIDGVALTLGMRVLLKNQTTSFQNGIYTVTTAGAIGVAGILTRATDTDQAADWKTGDSVFVTAGTTLGTTSWVYTGVDSPTMGTDAITWVQVSGQGSFTAGNGIAITGVSIAIDTSITADLSTAQTFTNKTLTSPKINENVALTTTATKLNLLTSAAGTTGTTSTNIVFSTSPNITTPTITTSLTMADAANIVINTTTGTKIGTATNQKIGFFNSAPIVQPTGDVITALQNLGLGASLTVLATTITSRTLWGQTYDGSGNVTGSLTAVADITGGASSMTITAGTGNSRTLTLRSTTSGGTATAFITGNADQSTTFGGNISGTGSWTLTGGAGNMTIVSGTGASRTMILQTTTSGSTATTALTLGADQSATFAGTVALGANNLTMTGSIASTGSRVTKVWTAALESTAMPTVGGTAILTSLTAPRFTTIELGAASDTTLSRVSAGLIAVEGITLVDVSTAQTLTTKTLTTPVINGTITGTGQATAATASTIMMRDASANTSINNLVEGFTTTATVAGTTTMTITSTYTQVWTGSSTQTVKLPTTSVLQGQQYLIINQSTGAVTVQSSGANTILVLAGGTSGLFTAVVATPTTAANWSGMYYGDIITSGKALSVLKTMSFTAADDTGTYTLPTGTKTLVATDVATLSSLTTTGNLVSGSIGTGFVVKGVTMTMGSDATGDMYYRNSSGVLTRIAPGAQNTVLTMGASSVPAWATAGGGSWVLKASGTATADFSITSLDLDTDQLYKLTIYAYGGSGAATKMTYNSNTTDSYETVANTTWRNGGAATDAAAGNRGTDGVYLNRITGGEPQTAIQLFEILISKASGIRPVCHFSYAGMSTSTAPTEKTEGVGTLENTTNVTSIQIDFSSSPTAVRYWLEKIATTV